MKGSPGFGAPKRQRFAMQFGYDVRPSFWQEVKSNSHLVIAAIGTAALLGVAGTALWLAMPAGDQEAFAQAEQPAAVAEIPAKVEPAKAQVTDQSAPAATGPAAPVVATAKANAVTLQAAEAQDDIAALPANDPRWSGSTHKQSRAPAEGAAQANKEAATASTAPPPLPTPEQAASVAAYQPAQETNQDSAAVKVEEMRDAKAVPAEEPPTHPKPDKAETAAIPAVKPAEPAPEQAATANGRILRDVTLRSGPKKGAAPIGTIPAKSAVQVISCKSWCQVVYKGKRGWIYKSFLDSKARRASGATDPVRTKSVDVKPPAAAAKPAKVEEKPVAVDPLEVKRQGNGGHS